MKAELFACDNRCGQTVVIGPNESLSDSNWYHMFGPKGTRSAHICSELCLSQYSQELYEKYKNAIVG